MHNLVRALGELALALSVLLPPSVRLGLAVGGALVVVPWWFELARGRQIRGVVRQIARGDPSRREALEAWVIRVATGRVARLRALVEAATRYRVPALRERGLALLEQAGDTAEVKRIRRSDHRSRFVDAEEAAVHVERLLRLGRTAKAAEHLAEARLAFPRDPDLAALERRIDAG